MTNSYPTWRYHPEKKAVIVNTPAQEEDLGPGWRDTPYPQKPEAKPNGCKDCAKLKAMFDVSWAEKTKDYDALRKKFDALMEEYKAIANSDKKGK